MTAVGFDGRWLAIDGIFGGFVLGRIVDAAGAVDGFVPQAVTVHFLSAVRAGDADLRVETVHRGRATASVRVELGQDGRVRAHAIASLVPAGQDFLWRAAADPTPWGQPCRWPACPPEPRLPYGDHLEVRPVGAAALEAGAAAWVRFARPLPALGPHGAASVLLDVLPPGLFSLAEPPAFVPTVDFTVHFAPRLGAVGTDWHLLTHRTVWATREFCVDEATLHDPAGHALAQLRQGRAIRWTAA